MKHKPLTRSATFSEDGKYRYELRRTLQVVPLEDSLKACFIMLNPSTADGFKDDATVRKCMGFARDWGCTEIIVVNLFGFRATKPADLKKAKDPTGPHNEAYVFEAVYETLYQRNEGLLVAAFGNHGTLNDQDGEFYNIWLEELGEPFIQCLGHTDKGAPRHPLYVSYETPLEEYTPHG